MTPGISTSHEQRQTFELSRSLFFRALGVVFAIALVSLWVQVDGLIDSQGSLPASKFLNGAGDQLGAEAWFQLPTIFWLSSSDWALHAGCAAGVVLSVLLIIGIAPRLVLAGLWLLYLSLSVAGQVFFEFQWDVLLLETALFAMFYAPVRGPLTLALSPQGRGNASPLARWALWWLLFKLMFLSGITKLISGDPTWRDLSAMNYHYWTQPIPNWISWYVHQLPDAWHRCEVLFMYICEIVVPILIFFPRPWRHMAGLAMIALQLALLVTGNFGFFNLLTITLCLTLFDDRLLPARVVARQNASATKPQSRGGWLRVTGNLVLGLLVFVSVLTFLREIVRTRGINNVPAPVANVQRAINRHVLSRTDPFRSISGYGLFRVMTTTRPEIIVEGSADGQTWSSYEFRWKPGDPGRAPGIVAPHMPRLDWLMWFAALHPPSYEEFLAAMMKRIQDGEPAVLRLMKENPFPDKPPRYLRLVLYQYEFTDKQGRRDTGNWWKRERVGVVARRSRQ